MYYFNPDTIMTNSPKMSFDQKVSVSGTRSRDEYSGNYRIPFLEIHAAEFQRLLRLHKPWRGGLQL